jgi:hypothetical protein
MEQRNLQVIKWEGKIPAVAICTSCNSEFRVLPPALSRTSDAEANLRQQFEHHSCDSKTSHTSGQASPSIYTALISKRSLVKLIEMATKAEHWDMVKDLKKELKTVQRQCEPPARPNPEELN